jgi:hypothetical protein
MLKPGGQATIMRYHHPSLSGAVLWLWLRFGIFSGKSLRRVVYDHFESPGTKTYTEGEVRSMMMATGFEDLVMLQVFSPGDLLLNRPSARFLIPIPAGMAALSARLGEEDGTPVGTVSADLGAETWKYRRSSNNRLNNLILSWNSARENPATPKSSTLLGHLVAG